MKKKESLDSQPLVQSLVKAFRISSTELLCMHLSLESEGGREREKIKRKEGRREETRGEMDVWKVIYNSFT